MTHYDHFSDVPEEAWRWPNFSPAEIACRGTGKLLVKPIALDMLQSLRDRLGKPLIINSAYRSPEHNRAVGGATRSKHMDGTAFDIAMSNHDPVAFEAAARIVGFKGFGFYPRSNFIHIDLGPAREWGTRFPPRKTGFAVERPIARENLAGSRTIAGAAVAGGSAAASEFLTVVQDAQGQVAAVAPYNDGAQNVLLVLILAGAALAIYARVSDHRSGRR